MMMYTRGQCDGGTLCITTPATFLATHFPCRQDANIVLHDVVLKHKCLLSEQNVSLSEIERQEMLRLYQTVSSESQCLCTKIIAENNAAQILYQNREFERAHLALERAVATARYARQLHGDNPTFSSEILLPIFTNLGRVHFILGEYDSAMLFVLQALEHCQQCPAPFSAGALWYNMALLLKLLNKGRDERLYALNRANHILTSLEDNLPYFDRRRSKEIVMVQIELLLAQSEQDEGQVVNEAAPLLKGLIRQREEFGYNHVTVSEKLCNLANFYMNKNDFSHASHFYGEAVRICQRLISGDELLLIPLTQLGKCFQALARYGDAMACFRSALNSTGRTPIHEHKPDKKAVLATVFYCVGMIQFAHGSHTSGRLRRGLALKSFHFCLQLRRSCFGNEHPAVASALNNIGILYLEEGNITLAKGCFIESLRIRKTTYGLEHHDVAISLRHVGRIHQDCGEYSQAVKLYTEALLILRRSPRECTSELIEVLVGLGQAQHSLSLMNQAYKSYEEATSLLRNRQQSGQQDTTSHIVRILKIMGNLSIDMSELESARFFFAEASRLSGREEDENILSPCGFPSAAAA